MLKLFLKKYLLSQNQKSVVRTLSFISVFGVGLGVMAMIVVLSVMNGFDEAIEKRILRVQPHVVVREQDPVSLEKIKTIVKHGEVQGFTRQDVIVRTLEGIFSGAILQGAKNEKIQSMGSQVVRAREVFEDQNGVVTMKQKLGKEKIDVLGQNEVVVGADLARSLGIFAGDEVLLIAPESLLVATEKPIVEKVRVKALLRSDVSEIDSRFLFYNKDLGLKKMDQTASLESGVEIFLEDPFDALSIKSKLQQNKITQVQTWQDLNAALFYSLKMEKRLMGVFLALTILVSSFSIMSVLFFINYRKKKGHGNTFSSWGSEISYS
jgi:lipoprotein-releasing system permease protein